MARILVLGGAGFIGGHLAARLAAAGHALTLVDDLSRGRRDAAIESLAARPNVRFVEADLTRAGALDAVPRDWDISDQKPVEFSAPPVLPEVS